MTSEAVLEQIVGLCLDLDRHAVEVYRQLAAGTTDQELAEFWRRMSGEEEEHVIFWEKLDRLVRAGHLPQIFQYPEKTRDELEQKLLKAREVAEASPGAADPSRQFLVAFQLEFYLLHPALEKLWHFFTVVRPGEKSPEEQYDSHLRHFTTAMRRFCGASPELQLLGESVLQMWSQLRELTHEAEIDVLTRVLNRRGLFNDMKMLAHLARRNAFTAGVLLIDIDHFKVINDRYGHQVGDTVLSEIAQIISAQVRKSDVVGRYGGEEFLVFLPQTESSRLERLAEKIRLSVEAQTRERFPATISVGAACTNFPVGVEEDLDSLIRVADDCLYQAKAAGRNRVITRSCPN